MFIIRVLIKIITLFAIIILINDYVYEKLKKSKNLYINNIVINKLNFILLFKKNFFEQLSSNLVITILDIRRIYLLYLNNS